jgi:hypothetical protein
MSTLNDPYFRFIMDQDTCQEVVNMFTSLVQATPAQLASEDPARTFELAMRFLTASMMRGAGNMFRIDTNLKLDPRITIYADLPTRCYVVLEYEVPAGYSTRSLSFGHFYKSALP